MRQLEGAVREELQVSSLELMEIAGEVVFDAIESEFGQYGEDHRAVVLCGPGNNGGDGWVVARLLAGRGTKVTAIASPPATAEATECRQIALDAGVEEFVGPIGGEQESYATMFDEADLVVDGLFGLGLNRPVGQSPYGVELINVLNQSHLQSRTLKVVSIDVPSGLSESVPLLQNDQSANRPHWVCPTMTVTFELPKIVHVVPPHSLFVGKLLIRPLAPSLRLKDEHQYATFMSRLENPKPGSGAPKSGLGDVTRGPLITVLDDPADIALVERSPWSHKGDYGRVTIVAGSPGKVGAARLAGLGALRGGAGLVTVATPKSCVSDISQTPELMTLALPDHHGKVMARGAEDVLALKSDVVAVGPGFGTAVGASKLVLQLLDKYDGPLILDADALNVLDFEDVAIQKAFLQRAVRAYKTNQRYAVIMTPHVGEFSRLTGRTVEEINADPISASSEFARRWGVWLVLKGTRTILAKPTGHLVINTTGNPGMATAGCGDVLTGVIAACLAKREVERRYDAERVRAPFERIEPYYFKDITAYETILKKMLGRRVRIPILYRSFNAHWSARVLFGGEYTLGVLEAVYIHGRAGDLAARAQGEVSLIASDVLKSLGEAFTSVTEKSYFSGSNDRYGTQVTERNRSTPSHEALVSDHSGCFQGCADLATKFFGADAVRDLFDMLIDIKNAKELEDEARKTPCENCGKPMELYCGETFGAWYFRCSKSPNCKGKRQILGSN